MAKKEFSDKELERLSIVWGNSLVDGERFRGSLVKGTSKFVVGDGDDGVEVNGALMLESQPYTRIFCGSDVNRIIYQLSPRASSLLLWLMINVVRGLDLIHIDRHKYMKDVGVSRQETYLHAIADLSTSGVILKAPRYTDLYFINPHVFFKGNRLMRYKDKLRAKNVRNIEKLT